MRRMLHQLIYVSSLLCTLPCQMPWRRRSRMMMGKKNWISLSSFKRVVGANYRFFLFFLDLFFFGFFGFFFVFLKTISRSSFTPNARAHGDCETCAVQESRTDKSRGAGRRVEGRSQTDRHTHTHTHTHTDRMCIV